MKHVVVDHYLSHLYGALKTNKARFDQLNSEIEGLKKADLTESEKNLRQMIFQQQQIYVVVVILANSMIEALANQYLVNKCDAEQFEALERLNTLDKLTVIPKLFLKEYKSPKGEVLYEDLTNLFSLRKSMVHPKPRVVVNGQTVHKGNLAKSITISKLSPEKCVTLPIRMVEHLCLYDHGSAFELCIYSGFDAETTNRIISRVRDKSLKKRTQK